MPRDSESNRTALTPFQLEFLGQTPHTRSEQDGMDGSGHRFCAGPWPLRSRKAMTTQLPEIRWMNRKKRCADCNRGTHLSWESACRDDSGRAIHSPQTHNRYWICRACAERRGGIYRRSMRQFLASRVDPLAVSC